MSGTSAWSGPYSDGDDRWTPRLKSMLDFDPNKHLSKERGVFWMDLENFLREFESL